MGINDFDEEGHVKTKPTMSTSKPVQALTSSNTETALRHPHGDALELDRHDTSRARLESLGDDEDDPFGEDAVENTERRASSQGQGPIDANPAPSIDTVRAVQSEGTPANWAHPVFAGPSQRFDVSYASYPFLAVSSPGSSPGPSIYLSLATSTHPRAR